MAFFKTKQHGRPADSHRRAIRRAGAATSTGPNTMRPFQTLYTESKKKKKERYITTSCALLSRGTHTKCSCCSANTWGLTCTPQMLTAVQSPKNTQTNKHNLSVPLSNTQSCYNSLNIARDTTAICSLGRIFKSAYYLYLLCRGTILNNVLCNEQ